MDYRRGDGGEVYRAVKGRFPGLVGLGRRNEALRPEFEGIKELLETERQHNADVANLLKITRGMVPRRESMPKIEGMDIYGVPMQLSGTEAGGDHVAYFDFKKYSPGTRILRAEAAGNVGIAEKLRLTGKKAGILLADISGHSITDAALAGMLHHTFTLGIPYELDMNGEVTSHLLERINTDFYVTLGGEKYITMIYAEVAEDGTLRFISAAHPPPVVFSREYDKIVDISADQLVVFPPIGTMPSEMHADTTRRHSIFGLKERYVVNERQIMGRGDVLVLYTDGLSDHSRPLQLHTSEAHIEHDEFFFPNHLEKTLRMTIDGSAEDIYNEVMDGVRRFGEPQDDVTCVVVKKL